MTHRYRSLVCLLAMAVLFTAGLQAQVTTATVQGRVLDPTGAVVPGASVTASNQANGAEFATTASSSGEFTLTYLPAGVYSMIVEADGFKVLLETDLQLGSGQRASIDYSLELGVATETVTITSEAPLLNLSLIHI